MFVNQKLEYLMLYNEISDDTRNLKKLLFSFYSKYESYKAHFHIGFIRRN